jgi:cyclophilin family peptidyl-prolyl cis-trans isomerase
VAVSTLKVLAGLSAERSIEAVVQALDDKRSQMVTAALQAMASHPARFRVLVERPSRSMAGGTLVDVVERVVSRYEAFDEAVAPLVSALRLAEAFAHPALLPLLNRLVDDTRPPVRAAALQAYGAIRGGIPPTGLPALRPMRDQTIEEESGWRATKALALVQTTRGDFVIELDGGPAPLQVSAFAALAESGYFNGAPLHFVDPGRSVHGGDPSGTGLGDPGFGLRSAWSMTPFERGTVGLESVGRDDDGARFFVCLARQPGLDGKRTVLGKVTSGMETVDLLDQGDQITRISIRSGD